MKYIMFCIMFILFNGCYTNYKDNYTHFRDQTKQCSTKIMKTDEYPNIRTILENGFVLIGYSVFNYSSYDYVSDLKIFTSNKKFQYCLYKTPEYLSTKTFNITRNEKIEYNESQDATISNGYKKLYINSNTNGYINVPITRSYDISFYNYSAIYLEEIDYVFGIYTETVNNQGAIVDIVVKNSPAFISNIQPKDTIKYIDSVKIISLDQFNELEMKYSKKTVNLVVCNNFGCFDKIVKFQ